jgi:hypothetical protein
MELNERHFLPHAGLYLGAPRGPGRVVRVDRKQPGELNLRDRVEAQHRAAARREW